MVISLVGVSIPVMEQEDLWMSRLLNVCVCHSTILIVKTTCIIGIVFLSWAALWDISFVFHVHSVQKMSFSKCDLNYACCHLKTV